MLGGFGGFSRSDSLEDNKPQNFNALSEKQIAQIVQESKIMS